jgi:hypothetical protein
VGAWKKKIYWKLDAAVDVVCVFLLEDWNTRGKKRVRHCASN